MSESLHEGVDGLTLTQVTTHNTRTGREMTFRAIGEIPGGHIAAQPNLRILSIVEGFLGDEDDEKS